MASYQIAPPETFNFARPEEWPKWIRRFERFHQVSDLSSKPEESQVNILIYSMGYQADDILRSFALSEEDLKSTVMSEIALSDILSSDAMSYTRGSTSTSVSKWTVRQPIRSSPPYTASRNIVNTGHSTTR